MSLAMSGRAPGFGDTQGLGNIGRHQLRVPQRGQVDEDHSIRMAFAHHGRDRPRVELLDHLPARDLGSAAGRVGL